MAESDRSRLLVELRNTDADLCAPRAASIVITIRKAALKRHRTTTGTHYYTTRTFILRNTFYIEIIDARNRITEETIGSDLKLLPAFANPRIHQRCMHNELHRFENLIIE